ncbi:hypothetical protein ABIE09_003251 [Lysobacter enzymogenes]|uniref:hypothetical protein n=1 Tax=Lysobacter enzymogenes TaxID=69 RepID=UPI0033967DFD
MNGFRPLGPIRPYFAALALALSLAACERAAPSAAAPVEPAAPPDLAQGPVAATLSADGRTLAVGVAERSLEEGAAEFFNQRADKFDKVAILAQGKRDDVYQALVRAEAASDPKRDGGRCRDGREVVLRHLEFDLASMSMTSNQDLESCLRRIRVVAQRRSADGGFEYDLEKTDDDGSTSPIYLRYDGKDYVRAAAH